MISILMATYNGEKYLEEQLASLFIQTCQDFVLYVQDDCSTDNTMAILKKYAAKYPQKVIVSQTPHNLGSAKFNFLDLMIKYKGDYVMLCDQDDVWLPDKIELSLTKIKKLETSYGINTPLLVHTDLTVVDENLNILSASFKYAMNANYSKTKLKNQIIQNTLTGCTAIYNNALAKLICIQPNYIVMHDWWIMLIASAFGNIEHINDQTVLYRQHGANQIGAKDVRKLRYQWNMLINNQEIKNAINATYQQANSFLRSYGNLLDLKYIYLVETYCKIPQMHKLKKWYTICKLGTLKNGFARNLAYFAFI